MKRPFVNPRVHRPRTFVSIDLTSLLTIDVPTAPQLVLVVADLHDLVLQTESCKLVGTLGLRGTYDKKFVSLTLASLKGFQEPFELTVLTNLAL